MQVLVKQGEFATIQADALIVSVFGGAFTFSGITASLDQALNGLLSQELAANTSVFKGKVGDTLVLPLYQSLFSAQAKPTSARYVIVVGLGKRDEYKAFAARRASAAAVKACMRLKLQSAALCLDAMDAAPLSAETAARLLTEGAYLGAYQFTLRKGTKTEASPTFESLFIISRGEDTPKTLEESVQWGRTIAENTNLARDWVNDSPNHVTPTFLKEQAEAIPGLSCTVLDRPHMQKLGMGALTLVAQGSDQPAYLIHLCYKPAQTDKKTAPRRVALVGKGITFDSGGLSLKPSASMETMKMDMAGAAAVLATMRAIATLQNLPLEVHAFIPTCENMPSGGAAKPGDIVTAMNGKTIEVNNTDAEGRLILADALVYAQQECNPDEIIDLATLTGACITALGKAAAGSMGTCDALNENVRKSGEQAGEKFWPLPLYDEYQSFLKSDVADMINSGAKGEAGSSAGGMFLKEFIDENRAWVHLDIAGPAWISNEVPEVPKGASGFGVRTLLYYLYGLH